MASFAARCLITVAALLSIIIGAPISDTDAYDDYDYEESAMTVQSLPSVHQVTEKIPLHVKVRVNSSPESFFFHLPSYLGDVSTNLRRTNTALHYVNFDQLFAKPSVGQEDPIFADVSFSEIHFKVEIGECGPKHLCDEDILITQVCWAFTSPTGYGSLSVEYDIIRFESPPPEFPLSIALVAVICVLALACCVLVVYVAAVFVKFLLDRPPRIITVIPEKMMEERRLIEPIPSVSNQVLTIIPSVSNQISQVASPSWSLDSFCPVRTSTPI